MKDNNRFYELFPKKPIIGMIHLAGKDHEDKVKRALDELIIFQEEGLAGAIIEDYHGDYGDVVSTLEKSYSLNLNIILGINILRDPYSAFKLASDYKAKFIQFDSVLVPPLDSRLYRKLRKEYPDIIVFGGVGFKYTPITNHPVEVDLRNGKLRCDAIVTTGPGTGIETSIQKLIGYKSFLRDFPLIVGAGVNPRNAHEQLSMCDGAIIGSYFKIHGNTENPIERSKVKEIMSILNGVL